MRKRFILTLSFLFCIFSSGQSADQILPLSEIKSGMKGYGKTVFSGSTIETFDIEVIDILENYSPQFDIILVRLIGPRVEHTGVVSGMSGSPIYIDNKLIGALALSFGIFQKEPIAGVTPIEQMLKIEDKEQHRDQEDGSHILVDIGKRRGSQGDEQRVAPRPCVVVTEQADVLHRLGIAGIEAIRGR